MPVKPIAAQIEYKRFHFELKSVDEDQGIIEGYLSTFGNVDSGKDRVVKGAFKKTLTEAKSRMANQGKQLLWAVLWMHTPEQPLGKVLDAYEDTKGLYVKFWLDISMNAQGIPNNPLATMVFSGYKNGYIDSQSMGYKAIQKDYDGEGVRNLKEIQVWELSCVTSLFAMNDEAVVTDVKTAKGKTQMPDTEKKDFAHYYQSRQISDWKNQWYSMTGAFYQAVMDAFGDGDSNDDVAADIALALNGDGETPGFIHAVQDWASEGVELGFTSASQSSSSSSAYGYMTSALDDLENKKGAAISRANAARLSSHADTLELAHKAIRTVADDMRQVIGRDPFTQDMVAGDGSGTAGGSNKDGPGSKSRQQVRPRIAPNINDQPLSSTDGDITDADLLAWLETNYNPSAK